MMPVSSVKADASRPLTATEKLSGTPAVRTSGEEVRDRPPKPVMDEYVPEEPQEPSGRYWVTRDGDGQPKIFFDGPERTAAAHKEPEKASSAKKPNDNSSGTEGPEQADRGAKSLEQKDGEKEERCVGNTDKVDREIEKLKKKQRELEQRLGTETDASRIKDLERQLAQVERELKRKDNDTYRKQHAAFTRLS